MTTFQFNGQQLFFDEERYKSEYKFLNYKELQLKLSHGDWTSKNLKAVNEFIYENYPQYREFIK